MTFSNPPGNAALEQRGPESLAHLLRLMAAHDLVHRRQIDRVLGAA